MRAGSAARVLLASALAACGRAPTAAVPTVVVKKTRFERIVEADGHLKPVQSTTISAPRGFEGPVRISWLIEDGSVVKKGDVVARFDDTDIRARLRGAEDDQTTATTKKDKEALLVAQARSERRRTTEAAKRELALAQQFQRKDTELYSRDDIITSEIDHELQTERAGHAQAAQGADAQIARRKLQLLEVERKKAAEAIARAEKGLATLEAKAPHDGVVLFKRSWRGETFAVGDQAWGALADVSRSDEMEAEVFVLEAEAAGLATAKGKKADLMLESHPGRTWKATVKRVESVAKRRQFRSPTQYFGVTLALEKTDAALMKPGQRVRARLALDARDALVVPRPALFQKDGKWIAYRRSGDAFQAVTVKIGASTAGRVSIESGLADGDVIALRDPAQSLDDILAAPPSGAATRGR